MGYPTLWMGNNCKRIRHRSHFFQAVDPAKAIDPWPEETGMKALFFRSDFLGSTQVGGSFSHTRGFLHGLKQLGHDYCVATSGPLDLNSGGNVYHIPYPRLFRNLPEILSIAYNFRLIPAVKNIIASERPDFLYHRHSEFNYSSVVLSRHFGLPLVLECNGSEVWVKKNWGRVYFERILRLAENVQFLGAHIITVVSNVMKEDLTRMGVDENKILVNPNGVDPDRFRPDIDGMPVRSKLHLEGKTLVGFVGTFGAWHGVEVLAKSIKPTITRNPDIHFLIIGEGGLREQVERIIHDDGVEAFVTLAGSVAHSDIPAYLAACDILVSPHVHNPDGTRFFGSPTKLFEYMAMGKAIVASGVGQIGEIIKEGLNGLLMREGDHADLAEKVALLAANVPLRKQLGQAARNDAFHEFSWKKNAERVIRAVQPLVKR